MCLKNNKLCFPNENKMKKVYFSYIYNFMLYKIFLKYFEFLNFNYWNFYFSKCWNFFQNKLRKKMFNKISRFKLKIAY